MPLHVLYFATLKQRAGRTEESVDLPEPPTIAGLKQHLARLHPDLEPALASALASINKEFAMADDALKSGDEVALFPPVSGGAAGMPNVFRLTEAPLDMNEVLEVLILPTTGAACVFSGMVRGQTERGGGHQTLQLKYEAYQPMAEAKMRQVADEIRQRWPAVEGIAIVQRLGDLEPGTPTVLIACTAAHRDTGVFEAARYGIDRLKQIVPIWKKEIGPDGEVWVEGDYIPDSSDRA
jgi:molybdopterin converting factor subunit 1